MRILTARWPGLAPVLCFELANPWSGELAKGPPSSLPPSSLLTPPSLPYSGNVKLTARLSALAVRKTGMTQVAYQFAESQMHQAKYHGFLPVEIS